MSTDEARGAARDLVAAYKIVGLTMEEIAGVLSFAFAEVVDDPDTSDETVLIVASWVGVKPQ